MRTGVSVRFLSALPVACALAACTVNGTVTQDRDVTVSGIDETAQPVGHGKQAFMAAYDADGDGSVPRAEFDRVRRDGYDRRDADAGGSVTKDEYVAEFEARFTSRDQEDYQRQMRQTRSRFDVLDDDGDGALSWAEFADSGDFVFTSLDSNSDGVVDDADDAEAY